jgi:hypothetical protein
MRKGIRTIGICFLFLGLILIGASQIIVESNTSWLLVDYKTASGMGTDKLSVQGNLTEGDVFLVNFTIRPPEGAYPDVAGVNITITDPNNNKAIYEVEIGAGPQFLDPFPTGTVNVTGPYKVDADARIVNLTRLDLRTKLIEKKYPYSSLFIVGGAIFGSGAIVSIIAFKTSKHKRHIPKLKTRFSKISG